MARKALEVNSEKTRSIEQGLKLLLVDEDAKDLDYYSMVLQYLGYNVHAVDSYVKAAGALRRGRFDLVIVDQGSTDFEGRSVLSRAVEIDRHVPVLVLTRNVDVGCCMEALDAGANEYVQKPLTASEVRELVRDYVKPPTEEIADNQDYALQAGFVGGNNLQAGRDSWQKAS